MTRQEMFRALVKAEDKRCTLWDYMTGLGDFSPKWAEAEAAVEAADAEFVALEKELGVTLTSFYEDADLDDSLDL